MKSRVQLAIEQENEIEKIVQSATIYDGVDYCGEPHPTKSWLTCIRGGGKCLARPHIGIVRDRSGNESLIDWE